MPRAARKKSESGYYHLIMRGVSRQVIFEDRTDYIHFLNLLKRFGIETKVRICAFCLMVNHVHLLVCDRDGHLSLFMQKLGTAYSWYFNHRYERTGHLFEDRYGSVPIESEEQLLTVFRYILNNPQEAGICPAAEYEWSSYSRYGNPNSFVDTLVLKELLGSFAEYEAFINAKGEDICKVSGQIIHNDEWAKGVMREVLNGRSGSVLRSFDWDQRNEILRILKKKGLSLRQIERLTGISKSVIQRA